MRSVSDYRLAVERLVRHTENIRQFGRPFAERGAARIEPQTGVRRQFRREHRTREDLPVLQIQPADFTTGEVHAVGHPGDGEFQIGRQRDRAALGHVVIHLLRPQRLHHRRAAHGR